MTSADAPRVSITMKSAEDDVRKRLEEHPRQDDGEDGGAESDASGFISCSDTEEEVEDDDDGVWI